MEGKITFSQNTIKFDKSIDSPTFTGTVNGVSKSMVGLGNCDNTSDLNKPVSIATQAALATKSNINSPTFTGESQFQNVTVSNDFVVHNTTNEFIYIDSDKSYKIIDDNNIIVVNSVIESIELPENPNNGAMYRISNMSDNDIYIHSTPNTIIYNLLLAPTGTTQIPLQKNFLYNFIYTKNKNNLGIWNLSF